MFEIPRNKCTMRAITTYLGIYCPLCLCRLYHGIRCCVGCWMPKLEAVRSRASSLFPDSAGRSHSIKNLVGTMGAEEALMYEVGDNKKVDYLTLGKSDESPLRKRAR